MSLRVRRERRAPTKFKLHKSPWVDPFPWIPGTHPEKLLFAALVSRGIYFRFQDKFPAEDAHLTAILQDRGFEPDFICPEYKVIFDPYGDFAHSRPGSVGHLTKGDTWATAAVKLGADIWKQVYYESKGYEFIHPWTSDIIAYGPEWMIDLSKRIAAGPTFPLDAEDRKWKATLGYKLGPFLGAGTKGTAAANKVRAKRNAWKHKGLTLRVGRQRSNIRRTR